MAAVAASMWVVAWPPGRVYGALVEERSLRADRERVIAKLGVRDRAQTFGIAYQSVQMDGAQ